MLMTLIRLPVPALAVTCLSALLPAGPLLEAAEAAAAAAAAASTAGSRGTPAQRRSSAARGAGGSRRTDSAATAQTNGTSASSATFPFAAPSQQRQPQQQAPAPADDVQAFGRMDVAAAQRRYTPDVDLDALLPAAPPAAAGRGASNGTGAAASTTAAARPAASTAGRPAGVSGATKPQLVVAVDGGSWQRIAAAAFPSVYDAGWHATLYEFLFDLWPALSKAHSRQQDVLNGSSSSNAHVQMLRRGYRFVELCARSEDPHIALVAAASFAENVGDSDTVLEGCWGYLSRNSVRGILLPAARALLPANEFEELCEAAMSASLDQAAAAHGLAAAGGGAGKGRAAAAVPLAPAAAPPPALAAGLAKLQRLRVLHPVVPASVLAYAEGQYV